jgi:broad specificity phosphatase PhoE
VRAIGERFRRHGIEKARVHSSRWCRCLETARLLDLGEVIPTPALDSFFTRRDRGPAQSEAVRRMLEENLQGRARIFVTHQVNITALTGIYPRSGEIVVVHPGESALEVAGRLAPR